jgi:hypothetical protein
LIRADDCNKEETMLAPNQQAGVRIHYGEGTKTDSSVLLEKFVFAALLVIAYAIACAAVAYPVIMYTQG